MSAMRNKFLITNISVGSRYISYPPSLQGTLVTLDFKNIIMLIYASSNSAFIVYCNPRYAVAGKSAALPSNFVYDTNAKYG